MIADTMTNKRFQAILKELCIRCKKLNISLVLITVNVSPVFIFLFQRTLVMKIHNQRELQQIAINHSADIDYKNLIKIYKKCTIKPYSFFVIDATLSANDPLRFRKNLLDPL